MKSLRLALLILAAGTALARAQPAAPPRPPAGRLGNILLTADRPTPWFWAEGCTRPEELPLYRETGLNTLVVEVRSEAPADLAAARALAEAAGKQGLFVVARLAPSPAGFKDEAGELIPPAALDPRYRERVARFVAACVPQLTSSSLVAWEVAAVDPDYLLFHQREFLTYLQQWYGNMSAVNAAWGTNLHATVLRESVVRLVDRGKPYGLGRASLDLATYRQQRYADLLALWARELRRADPGRLVLAGNVHYYRSASAVPRDCDGMVLRTFPGEAEVDPDRHNPQAIDIARHANAFAALPTLLVGEGTKPDQVRAWTLEAALHGAAGIGYRDWAWLRDHPEHRQAVARVLDECRQQELAPRAPAPQVAMLYEPLAVGALVGGRALYGHLAGLSVTEPGGLIYALRGGTRFGLVDYLSLSDLEQAERLPYRLVLAPLALQLSEQARAKLLEYVNEGGVLVADGEFGRFQAPGQPERLAAVLQSIFGVTPLSAPSQLIPLVGVFPHSLFPSLGSSVRSIVDLTTCPLTNEFSWMNLASGTQPVIAFQQAAPAYAGILARPVGRGWAIYASGKLFESWLPGRPYFDTMFTDLLGRDYDLALAGPDAFVGGPSLCRYQDGSILILGAGKGHLSLLTLDRQGRLFSAPGAVQSVRSPGVSGLTALWLLAQPVVSLRPIPVRVAPAGSQVLVQVLKYSNRLISLVAFGDRSQVQLGDKLVVMPAGKVQATFTVENGLYPVAPGSRHRLQIKTVAGAQPQTQEVTGDASGLLRFELECDLREITLSPAED